MFGRCVLVAVNGVPRPPDAILAGVTFWAGTCDNDSSLMEAVSAALPRRDVLHCTGTSGYEKSPDVGGCGGRDRDRTGDLSLFRRTLVPTELPGHLRLVVTTQHKSGDFHHRFRDPDGT